MLSKWSKTQTDAQTTLFIVMMSMKLSDTYNNNKGMHYRVVLVLKQSKD